MGSLLNDIEGAKGIWKVRVRLDDAYPVEYPEQREAFAGHWIDLREPDGDEAMALTSGDNGAILKLIGKCIVDHSFEFEPGKKAGNGDVFKMIKGRSTLSAHMIAEWVASLPLVVKSGTRLRESPAQ